MLRTITLLQLGDHVWEKIALKCVCVYVYVYVYVCVCVCAAKTHHSNTQPTKNNHIQKNLEKIKNEKLTSFSSCIERKLACGRRCPSPAVALASRTTASLNATQKVQSIVCV